MYCPGCGHQNPDSNKFCGMCGELLPLRVANKISGTPRTSEMSASDVIRAASEPRRPDPEAEAVLAGARRREASEAKGRKHDPDIPPAVMSFYTSRHEPVPTADLPMTIGGPSFLGLGGGSSRAYLMEENQPASLASKLFLLVVLAALGYAIYRNWVPLRGYVGEAFQQTRTVSAPVPAPSTPDAAAPAVAPEGSSTPADPSVSPDSEPPQDNAGSPASASPANGGPTGSAGATAEAPAPAATGKAQPRKRKVH